LDFPKILLNRWVKNWVTTKTLEKLLILASDVRGLTDPIFQRHLAITRQMAFQVREHVNFYVFLFGMLF
jgi:hypothetical protein